MEAAVSNAFLSISYLFLISALILNTIGVYLLRKTSSGRSNQNLLLMNMSIIKIIISITEIVLTTLQAYGQEEARPYQIFDIIDAALFCVNDQVVLIITADRLFAVVFSIQYNTKDTRKIVTRSVAAAWLIGTAGILPFFFIAYDLLYEVVYKIVFLSLDGLVIVTTLVTYSCILKQLLTSGKKFSNTANGESSFFKQYGQFFYISSLIILSFILFVAIPDIVYVSLVIIKGNEDPYIESGIGVVWSIYLVTDPLIYIFLQKPIRRKLKQLVTRGQVEPRETTRVSDYATGNDSNETITI